jgi:hypothetical protein
MTTTAPLFATARIGDRVTILVPNGIGRNGVEYTQRTGRVVMKFATHLVLNCGGRHGTPKIADATNTVKVSPSRH